MDTCIYASSEDLGKGFLTYSIKDLLSNKNLYYCERTEYPNTCVTPFDEEKKKY
jgi:hypothetical protein